MYFKSFYKDKEEDEILEDIKKDGFNPILLSHGAGYAYHPHSHAEEKLLVFVEGNMKVRAGAETYNCEAGDKLIIEGNVEHEAVCGDNGCKFFWAER